MRLLALCAAIGAAFAGCSSLGRDRASADFEKETSAAELQIREGNVRTILGRFEAAIADYYKAEKRIPPKLDLLVPKYLAEIPALDLPACGRESADVQYYASDVLRGGQVDGTRLKATGRWGYVYNDRQVVVFVDCLKPTRAGTPWFKERGVY